MPILIMPVSTRPPIAGTDGIKLKGYGDSIFASDRYINAIRNRFLTIVTNHAALMADQPLINYKTEQGIEIHDMRSYPGGVVNLPLGDNKLEPSPTKDISPTVISLLGELTGQLEQGMLPAIRGNKFESGTRYALEQEAGNRIFNPQLRSLNHFYADACRLIEEQLIAGGIKVKIQGEEKRKYYEVEVKPVDLKKPHIIKVEFTAKTPWSRMEIAQLAQMLKSIGIPDGWIWENILKIQDPKGLADLAAIELFEHSPKGAMKRAVEALVETRGDIQAAMSLIKDLDRMETQEDMALQPQEGSNE